MSLERTYYLPKNGERHTLQKLLVKRIGYEQNIIVLDDDFDLVGVGTFLNKAEGLFSRNI